MKYEKIIEKLESIMKGYSGLKFKMPMTKDEFNQEIGINITDQDWDNTRNWSGNEYGTQDFKIDIPTTDFEGDEITIVLTLEINNNDDKITHIVDVDEY